MTEGVATQVANEVVGISMALVKKELGYWWNSRKHVEAMREALVQLNSDEQDVRRKMEANAANNLVVPHRVPTWLKQVEDAKTEAAGIRTDGIGCCNIMMRYKAGRKSLDVLEKIERRVNDKLKIVWTDEQIPLAQVNHSRNASSTSSAVDDGNQNIFESRKIIFEEALKSLEPNNSKTHMIALCGMGGVGKTYMMDRLKKAVDHSNMFCSVVKVSVGENNDVAALQQAVAEQTGEALNQSTRDVRAELLSKRFLETSKGGQNKILVILDDIWKDLDLKDLGLPIPLPDGFKLFMTSRDESVCTRMGVHTDSIFKIGALNDVEAKTLFFDTVGLSKDDDPDLYKIGEDIVRRCFNLPISLKTIASNLRIRDESDWKEALSRLQDHDIKDHYENVHKIFEISYNRLQKNEEKAIFLLSGLFPDDFDIPVEELMRYGWGLKLFPRTTLARARTRLESCVKSLIRANLLDESDRIGCVKMHDLARAFTLSNSTEVTQASVVKHSDISNKLTEDANVSYQRILLKCTGLSKFPEFFNYPNLAYLKVMMDGVEQLNFPDDFYTNMEKLEVLCYEEMVYPPLPPRINQSSTHLRTLCLHGCKLVSDWSAIGDLDSLEVLSFAHSQIKRLPSVIGKLKKLKLLDLNGCLDLHIDDGVLRNLNGLQELYMRVSGQKAINFTNTNFDELNELSIKLSALEVEFFNKAQQTNMSFKNLERFKISIGCLLEDDKDLYSFQNTLKVVSDSNDILRFRINELFKKTEKLHLEVKDMKHLKDVSMHPLQESFSRLRVLEVDNCEELRYLFTVAMANRLRKLERLTVSNCCVLESLIHGEESEDDRAIIFQKLKFLSLMELPQLESLCDTNKVVELPQLVKLELSNLPNFTGIYPDSAIQQFFNKEIEDISMHPSGHLFSSLRVLNVSNCESLRHLFTVAMASGLRKLEKLVVYNCFALESLIHGDESEKDGVIRFQELKILSLENLQNLRNLCDIDIVVKLPQLAELKLWELPIVTSMQQFFNKEMLKHPSQHSFSSLRVLDVKGCESLRHVFTVATASGFRKLELLDVSACPVLESLIHDFESDIDGVIIFQELKFLILYNLPKLGSLCDIDKVVELPQLKKLDLSELPNFTSIYPQIAMQPFFNKQVVVPKLEILRISNMENLKQIWPSEITSAEEGHISMVREVEVEWCDSLVNFFPINPMPLLRNLEKLEVQGCNSIEVLFNIDFRHEVGKVEEVRSNLRSITVTNSDNLKAVWRIKGANNSQVRGFQAVENIHIYRCGKFRCVFTPVTTNFSMSAHLDTDIHGSSASLFYEALISLQPNNKATKIALCVGKSARMAEDLINAVEEHINYDLVVKLDTGREDNIIALQQATAEYIGEALTETSIEARATSLHKRFTQVQEEGKTNILVILHDLWKVLDLKDIGLSSSPLSNGFRLLIISRDENVCMQMGVEKSSILKIVDLDDNNEKTLFFERVGLLEDTDPDLYKIGEEIRMICANFPTALEAIASVLKANIKDKSQWEEALSRLQNQETEDNNDFLKIAFEMSYNNLKTDDEKAILFLCGFYPKNYTIQVEELTRYAWGLKLFPEVCTLAQARHRTKASIDGLMHTNFFTECYTSGCITLQQHAHDYLLSNFTQVKQASFSHGNMPKDADELYERIFIDCNDTCEFHLDFNYPNIKLLKLTGEEKLVKFPQDFYDRMENLEVVAYDGMVDPLLPSYSTNLRTLCLDSCSLTYDFSFIGNLINMEILRFANCDIQKLPSTIGKLKRLKVLQVTGCLHDLCIEDGVFQNLVNLEELYMFGKGISFTDVNYEELEILVRQLYALQVELDKNSLHLKDGSFDKLEKFKISMGCSLDSYITDSEHTLALVTSYSELVECKMNELFEKANGLYLQVKGMKNLEDVSFCNLRELVVCDCPDLTFLFTVQVASGLRMLESLRVSTCPVLETLIQGESAGAGNVIIMFQKLESMHLEELPSLMSLCDKKNIIVELHRLVVLELISLPNFTSIHPDDVMQAYAFLSTEVEIPNLEDLRIHNMEKLKQIWPGGEISVSGDSEKEEVNNNSISKLRTIYVRGCDSLENLFPCNPLPLLKHLQDLHVEECCSIKALFNMDMSVARDANINQLVSSLRSIYVYELENLREIWRFKDGGNINSSSSGFLFTPCFQAVTDIYISKCLRFRHIFAPESINFDINPQVHRSDD